MAEASKTRENAPENDDGEKPAAPSRLANYDLVWSPPLDFERAAAAYCREAIVRTPDEITNNE